MLLFVGFECLNCQCFNLGKAINLQAMMLSMVFLLNCVQLSSLVALKDWVAGTDISNFLILLCVGNKVDRIPGHPVHAKYRKQLRRIGESGSFDNLSIEFDEFGISET
jgi:hypothetical protein